MTHNAIPDAAVTLYRWNGPGQPAPPCGYVVNRTIYDLAGRATHTIDPAEDGSGTVRASDGTVVMTVCENWFYEPQLGGPGVMFVDMNDARPWRTSGIDAPAWLPGEQEGV
jgi:hypothetical protein